ncbi:carbonic anhydrase 1-like [Ptychodera flava]|uniref:carbonic anhydrase 1-like n=1 Tax=Ptychodera flava TaxID=63121 RepID=UPI00396A6C54
MSVDWSHHGNTGPQHWPGMFKDAGGHSQSPVDIVTGNAKHDPSLGALTYKYNAAKTKEISNTGHSFHVSVDGQESLLTGGPLQHKYQLDSFHAHWGSTDTVGSEHTVDGASFAAELHLVHWNRDLFKSFTDAVPEKNGLAVLGILLSVGKENPAWNKILDLFPKITHKGMKTGIAGGFDPTGLLPENTRDYYTYPGSLTTPPCYESVTWTVFKQPVELSSDQMARFRKLMFIGDKETAKGGAPANMVDNYRPPQPLYDR